MASSSCGTWSVAPCSGLVYDVVETEAIAAKERRALRAHSNASILARFAKAHADAFGLLYKPNREPNIQTHSFHPIHRVTPDGRLVVDFVVEFLQRSVERLDPDDPKSPWFEFRGGSTVIFDDRGHVRYAIEKRIDNPRRLNAQREFYIQLCHNLPAGPYKDALRGEPLSFAAIHRGY